MTNVGGDVEGKPASLDGREEIGEREGRIAVLADDDRRDPLAQCAYRVGTVDERAVGVAVRVHEAGREREAAAVDDPLAAFGGECAHSNDSTRRDANARSPRRSAGAVEER